jgi:hypothetical protein
LFAMVLRYESAQVNFLPHLRTHSAACTSVSAVGRIRNIHLTRFTRRIASLRQLYILTASWPYGSTWVCV